MLIKCSQQNWALYTLMHLLHSSSTEIQTIHLFYTLLRYIGTLERNFLTRQLHHTMVVFQQRRTAPVCWIKTVFFLIHLLWAETHYNRNSLRSWLINHISRFIYLAAGIVVYGGGIFHLTLCKTFISLIKLISAFCLFSEYSAQ